MPPAHSDIFASAPTAQERVCQPSPFDGILEKCRDLVCERLDEAVALMLDSAHDVITQLIKDTQVREEWRLYEEARKVAAEQRETVEKHFRAAYRADFQRRSDRARKIGKPFDRLDYSFDELELIGEDDYDETLRFNDMAQRLRNYCEEELSALDQRVGVLLGDAGLAAKDNPFGPEVICDAFKLACRQLDCESDVRRVFLKLFDDEVLDEIRSVYKAVNALLVRNSILPQIRYSVARTGGTGAGPTGGMQPMASAPGSDAGIGPGSSAGPQDLFCVLQSLVAAHAATAPAAATAAIGGAAAPAIALPPGAAAAAPFPATAGPSPVVPGAFPATAGLSPAAAGSFPAITGSVQAIAPAGAGAAFAAVPTLAAGGPEGAGAADGVGAVGIAPAVGGVVLVQGAELMQALTRIQLGNADGIEGPQPDDAEAASVAAAGGTAVFGNVLHQLKSSSLGAGMNTLDRMTLDIIAMLFDELFDDPKVPNAIKGLIGRLQIPVLKVAISDKSFFSSRGHPARRLLDAVGDVALRLPSEFNDSSPLFARIEAILQRLVEGFEDDLAIFTAVRDELLELMAEEDRRIEQEALAQSRQIEEMESLTLARNAAQQEVLARIRVKELPPAVLRFLAQEWIKLLLVVHAKEGVESAAWRDGVAAMDELIWSVEPKTTTEERRRLAALVPGLVRRLSAGIERAGIDESVRGRFFAELMTYHMQAISSAARAGAEAEARPPAGEASAAAVAQAAEAAPDGDAAQGAAAAENGAPATAGSLDFTAPITVQNPFGGGEVAVDQLDLDFTAEAIESAKARREASIRRALDNLKMGHWVEFRDPEREGKAKAGRLIFVSPKKTRYLFATDRAGKEIIQCSRAEIGRRFLTGQAVRLDEPPEESLFDRIMNGLVGKLRLSGRSPLLAH